jgi:hypothetical protein
MRVLHNVMHLVSSVFGCQHERLSRPFTIQQQSYMVCLECGRKQFYSMQEMRRLSRREVRQLHALKADVLHRTPANMQAKVSIDPTLAA